MTVSIATARRIAAEYASSMSEMLDHFASSTIAISDGYLVPMVQETRDEIENAAIVGDDHTVRQLRRLEAYLVDEVRRRGYQLPR